MTEEDFGDELEFEEFLAMSPMERAKAERRLEAEISRMMKEHGDWLDSLPLPRRVAYLRDSWLENIRKNRQRLRDPQLNQIDCVNKIWREGIRRGQRALVKLREYRRTGIYPGGEWDGLDGVGFLPRG